MSIEKRKEEKLISLQMLKGGGKKEKDYPKKYFLEETLASSRKIPKGGKRVSRGSRGGGKAKKKEKNISL